MFWILIAVVVMSPLAVGAEYAWTWALQACIVGALLFAWSVKSATVRAPPPVTVGMVWPIVALFGVAVTWATLQMSTITPVDWSHPLWLSSGTVLGKGLAGYPTVNPHLTGSAILRLLTYGGVFWLALQYGRRSSRAKQLFYSIALAGLAYGAYGLVIEFSGAEMILWYEKTAYRGNLTSTFVNRNSYATYAGLGLLCTTGLLIQLVGEANDEFDERAERLRRLVTKFSEGCWVLLVAWVVLATALLLTDSRGGILSTCIGLITLFVGLSVSRDISRHHAGIMAAIVLTGGIAFFSLSGGTVLQRLTETTLEGAIRPDIYGLTIEAISDRPWLGTGYGTFPEVFRIYRDESIGGIVEKAHNTYLELALELGIPAALALLLAVVVVAMYCGVGIRRRRRDSIYPALGLAATVLVGTHSLVDFSLQIPAVAVTYSLILGAACAQSWSSRQVSRAPHRARAADGE